MTYMRKGNMNANPYANGQSVSGGQVQGMGQEVKHNNFTTTSITNTNYTFFGFLSDRKSTIPSAPGGNGIQNTRVGLEDGHDANGVPHAHHTWIGYFEEGNFEEALKWNEKACKIRERDLTSGHPDTIAEKRCRALILAHLEKYDEAICDINKTLDKCKECLKYLGSEVLFKTMDDASTIYGLAGGYGLADILSEKACEGYEGHEQFGPNHPVTLSAMLRRAMFLEDRKRYENAKELYEKAYEGLQGSDPPSDPPDLDGILIMYKRARLFENLLVEKHRATGAFIEAKEACDKFLKQRPGDEDWQHVSDILGQMPP